MSLRSWLRAGVAALISATSLVVLAAPGASPAAADVVIGDCTIVSDPTPEHHTVCPGADLAGADLRFVELLYAELDGADLSGAQMMDAVLYGATLRGADLDHADLWDASLWTADLTGADLSFASVVRASAEANYTDADLTGTDFTDAGLSGATMTGATLTGAILTHTIVAPQDQHLSTLGTGAVATWSLGELPGLRAGTCDPPSGTTFPIGTTAGSCTFTDDSDNVATADFAVTVETALPVVTRQPGDQTVTRGWPAIFNAAATGPVGTPTPTVQWQQSSDGGTTFADIVGATATQYVRFTVDADSGLRIRAVFTNQFGSTASDAATLTVIPLVIDIGQASVLEGDTGTTVVRVPVSLSAAAVREVTVRWATGPVVIAPGPQASAPSDYVAASGTLTFVRGQTSRTIDITVRGDTVAEPDEYVAVTLSDPTEADLGASTVGYGIIRNDDSVPAVVPGTVTRDEGGAGSTTVEVPVSLTAPATVPVTVHWKTLTVDGASWAQADAGTDYVAASGTLTFAPGETTAQVPVTVIGDEVHEADELLVVSFTDPVGATMGGYWGLGLVLIADDDPLPLVVPGVGYVDEGSTGTTSVPIPLTLSKASTEPVTVEWSTIHVAGAPGDQAEPSLDYLPASGTVTFAPGQTAATVTVTVIGDLLAEPDEYLVVSFHDPTNAYMGGFWGLGFGVIVDDDRSG